MHFDDRNHDRRDRIAQSNRCVRVPARVEHDSVCPRPRIVQGIDQRAFVIRLQAFNFSLQFLSQLNDLFVNII